jgi:hypothetical protein
LPCAPVNEFAGHATRHVIKRVLLASAGSPPLTLGGLALAGAAHFPEPCVHRFPKRDPVSCDRLGERAGDRSSLLPLDLVRLVPDVVPSKVRM